MFFTPHTSVINHFSHRKSSAHFHNYLRIFFFSLFFYLILFGGGNSGYWKVASQMTQAT